VTDETVAFEAAKVVLMETGLLKAGIRPDLLHQAVKLLREKVRPVVVGGVLELTILEAGTPTGETFDEVAVGFATDNPHLTTAGPPRTGADAVALLADLDDHPNKKSQYIQTHSLGEYLKLSREAARAKAAG